jgi:CRP/FNR family transcriptional regulator, cyclic AMP receptor protein
MDRQARDFLSRVSLFGAIPDEALVQLMPFIVERSFSRGARVFEEGVPGTEMYVVRAGELEVRKRVGPGLGDAVLATLEEGDCFGEMSLFDVQPRSASVVATTDCRLWVLTNMDLYRLYQNNLEAYVFLVQNIVRELSRRMRRADRVIVEFALKPRDGGKDAS